MSDRKKRTLVALGAVVALLIPAVAAQWYYLDEVGDRVEALAQAQQRAMKGADQTAALPMWLSFARAQERAPETRTSPDEASPTPDPGPPWWSWSPLSPKREARAETPAPGPDDVERLFPSLFGARGAWAEMQRLQAEIDRLFDSAFTRAGVPMFTGFETNSSYAPALDIRDEGDAYAVRVDLPGVAPDDVEVTIEEGVLTVAGTRRVDIEREAGGVLHRERRMGRFERSVRLPEAVDPKNLATRFDDGVLSIELPKKEPRPAS